MAPPTLATLPTEILVRICNLLYDSHTASLAAISRVNKRCFGIAAAVLVDTITFTIENPAQLARDVEECKQRLGRRQPHLFPHVRRLVIIGRMESPYCPPLGDGGPNLDGTYSRRTKLEAGQPGWRCSIPTTTNWHVAQLQLHGFQFGSEHEHGRCAVPLDLHMTAINDYSVWSGCDHAPALAAYESDHHWRPLARLISQLPGLTDVIYRCPSQFPPCLLKALHANKKLARLHLQMFNLRSAYDDSPTIDPHEWDIITSPCLYSIWLLYFLWGMWSTPLPSRKLDAVTRMVGRSGSPFLPLSPSLREVRMVYSSSASEDLHLRLVAVDGVLTREPYRPTRPWNPAAFFGSSQEQRDGLAYPGVPSDNKGHLTHLHFDEGDGVPPHPYESVFGPGHCWIEKWDSSTDFSRLRTLALEQPVSQAQLLALQSTPLPEVTVLSLTCDLPSCVGDDFTVRIRLSQPDYQTYLRNIIAFLSGLPSLAALQLTGWDHAAHAFSFPSPRLERLLLRPFDIWLERRRFAPAICRMQRYLTLEGLTTLVSSFPCLTDLSAQVPRSRGDRAEVALYRLIGESLPNLRRLTLWLDASPPPYIITTTTADSQSGGEHDTPPTAPFPSGPNYPAVSTTLNSDREREAHPEWEVPRYRNGHIYDVLINSALDESLARQIFGAVGGKVETLMVRTYGGDSFELQDGRWGTSRGSMMGLFLAGVGREMVVERRNDEEVVVKEMGVPFGDMYADWQIDRMVKGARVQCFRRVWPETEGGGRRWWDDWESWPLDLE